MKGLKQALYPFQRLDHVGSMASAEQFLVANTTNLACMHARISVTDTEIRMMNIPEAEGACFWVGTPANPVRFVRSEQIHPLKPLVIVFNQATIRDMLRGSHDRGSAERSLWSLIFRALRVWYVSYDDVPLSDLVPTAAFSQCGFIGEAKKMHEWYCTNTCSAEEAKRVFDSMFIATYSIKLISACYKDGLALPIMRLGDILFKLHRTTFLNLIPGVLAA